MKRLSTALVIILLAAVAANADIYIKSKVHTDPVSMMGQTQPASDTVSEQWIGDNIFATVTEGMTNVIDLKKNVMFMVNHKDKSYVEMPMPIDLMKVLPPEAQAMAPMMQMTATVAPTSETKQIGQWNCTAYDATLTVMGMQMKMRMWASTAVPGDLAAFAAKALPVFMQATMRLNQSSIQEFAKIKGFQIATEVTGDMMGAKIRTTTEVVEITEKTAPAGTFAPPAGYTKKTTLSMQDLQRR